MKSHTPVKGEGRWNTQGCALGVLAQCVCVFTCAQILDVVVTGVRFWAPNVEKIVPVRGEAQQRRLLAPNKNCSCISGLCCGGDAMVTRTGNALSCSERRRRDRAQTKPWRFQCEIVSKLLKIRTPKRPACLLNFTAKKLFQVTCSGFTFSVLQKYF